MENGKGMMTSDQVELAVLKEASVPMPDFLLDLSDRAAEIPMRPDEHDAMEAAASDRLAKAESGPDFRAQAERLGILLGDMLRAGDDGVPGGHGHFLFGGIHGAS